MATIEARCRAHHCTVYFSLFWQFSWELSKNANLRGSASSAEQWTLHLREVPQCSQWCCQSRATERFSLVLLWFCHKQDLSRTLESDRSWQKTPRRSKSWIQLSRQRKRMNLVGLGATFLLLAFRRDKLYKNFHIHINDLPSQGLRYKRMNLLLTPPNRVNHASLIFYLQGYGLKRCSRWIS